MARLYAVRETGPDRVPITELIARAVRQAYAQRTTPVLRVLEPHENQQKEAA